jgi:hypothetical protein
MAMPTMRRAETAREWRLPPRTLSVIKVFPCQGPMNQLEHNENKHSNVNGIETCKKSNDTPRMQVLEHFY